MYSIQDIARIKWACRRGMLELDVVIMPFFEECFGTLTESEQEDFVALLECNDPDLFAWIMGYRRSDDVRYMATVEKIVAHNQSKVR